MAKSKRKKVSIKPRKKASSVKRSAKNLKAEHKEKFKDFIKILHTLGVSVKTHLKDLEIEEEELEELKGLFKEDFLTSSDKLKLKKILNSLLEIEDELAKLEKTLYTKIKPWVSAAKNAAPFSSIASLNILKKLHKGAYTKKALDMQRQLPDIRNLVMASFSPEKSNLFNKYPKILNKFKNVCKDFVDLEEKWGRSEGHLRVQLFEAHHKIERLIQEDIYAILNEILEVYNLRVEIYEWLLKVDNELKPRMLPALEQERDQINRVQQRYLALYRTHAQNLINLYKGEN